MPSITMFREEAKKKRNRSTYINENEKAQREIIRQKQTVFTLIVLLAALSFGGHFLLRYQKNLINERKNQRQRAREEEQEL